GRVAAVPCKRAVYVDVGGAIGIVDNRHVGPLVLRNVSSAIPAGLGDDLAPIQGDPIRRTAAGALFKDQSLGRLGVDPALDGDRIGSTICPQSASARHAA